MNATIAAHGAAHGVTTGRGRRIASPLAEPAHARAGPHVPRLAPGRIVRPALLVLAAARHWRCVRRLRSAPAGSLLKALIHARPELWGLLRVRFLSARWSAAESFARVEDHCATVEALGAPFSLLPHQEAHLIDLPEIAEDLCLVLDSPRWLLLDGLLALSLFQGGDRLCSIAFILSSVDGELTAYVGGVQGRRGSDTRDRYRDFTGRAHGVRPVDMIVELLRILCAEIGVQRLRAVSHRCRHLHGLHAHKRRSFVDPVTLDYDALWRERGGVAMPDGFHDLPLSMVPKPLDEVPRRKRAERRRRYEMIEAVRQRLHAALRDPMPARAIGRTPGA